MNKIKILMIGAVLLNTSIIAHAEESVSFDITADYFGKYIWRGQNVNDDPVFQPSASLSWNGFTAAWWASMDTTNINNSNGEFIEHDWSLDYSGDVPFGEGLSYSVGVINYYFPGAEDTTEIYWGLGFELPLNPSVTVYYDVDEIKGTYASFAIGHSVEKIAELSTETPINMEIGASLGWGSKSYNKGYWAPTVDSEELNDLAMSVSFPFEVSGWGVTPSINYVTLIDDSIRETDAYNKASDYFFVGIGISKSF